MIVNRGDAGGQFTTDKQGVSGRTLIGCQPDCRDDGFDELTFTGPAYGKTRTYTITF
jgi:hypothetical protein